MSLGKHIKKQIEAKGLRFNYVADACGVSQSAMYNYINERKPFPEPVLKLLNLQFDIDTDLSTEQSA